MAAGSGGEFAEREEQVLRHAVEHALGIEAGAFGVVVTAGGRQTQIERLGRGHGGQRAKERGITVRPGVLGAQLNELLGP